MWLMKSKDKIEIEHLRSALERLASVEAFTLSGNVAMHTSTGKELVSRIEYARLALEDKP